MPTIDREAFRRLDEIQDRLRETPTDPDPVLLRESRNLMQQLGGGVETETLETHQHRISGTRRALPEAGIREITAALMKKFEDAQFTTTEKGRGFVIPNGIDLRAVYVACTATRPVVAEISFGRWNPRRPVSYMESESKEGTLRLVRIFDTLLEMFADRLMLVTFPEGTTTEQAIVYRTALDRDGWKSAGERDGRAVWKHTKGA